MLIMIGCGGKVPAQNFRLSIRTVDKPADFVQKELKLKTSFSSKQECLTYIRQLPGLLQSRGYVSVSVDSILPDSSGRIQICLFTGEQFKWKRLIIKEQDKVLLALADIRKNEWDGHLFSQQQIVQLQQKLLDYFENNGYPFASMSLDSLKWEDNEVSAGLKIEKGLWYKMDSIRIKGNARISKNFLYHYLNLPAGGGYNRGDLEKINQRLEVLPYLKQSEPWNLSMLTSSYLLNLYLQPRPGNEIDAIAGFVPANQQTGGKLLFTADIKLKLQNAFAAGETITLNWQQMQPQSPRLNFTLQRPYLFNSPWGLEGSFELYKMDSAFLNITTSAGVRFVFSALQKGKISLQNFWTDLLTVDTAEVRLTKKLPDVTDMSVTSVVIEYEWINTDYQLNPRRGNECVLTITAGNKKIRKNSTVTQLKDPLFNYDQLYDTVRLNTYRLQLQLNTAQYFPLGKQSVLKTSLWAGLLQSPSYYTNELFRIGGYRILRGFDEESIYASRYAAGSLEYRYLLGLNSYLFVFTDWGAVKNTVTSLSNWYTGAGMGLAFGTKQNTFNICIADGKRNDLPLNIQASKIHLGFVSLF